MEQALELSVELVAPDSWKTDIAKPQHAATEVVSFENRSEDVTALILELDEIFGTSEQQYLLQTETLKTTLKLMVSLLALVVSIALITYTPYWAVAFVCSLAFSVKSIAHLATVQYARREFSGKK